MSIILQKLFSKSVPVTELTEVYEKIKTSSD